MDKFDYNRPDTRARIAARRQTRAKRGAPAVRPGPKRAVSGWLATGKIASLLLLIGALGGLVYVGTVPSFTVQDVDVDGTQALSAEKVAELAGARGQSIWLVDTDQIVERLKTNAYVEQASASLTLPGQLSISVSERRPEVRWQSGGALYLLDGDGRVLDTDETTPMSDTLVIVDRSNRSLQPNDMVDPDALNLGRVLSLRLPAELGLHPAQIAWNTDTKIFVTTADNRTIIFGSSDNLDGKLQVLGTLIKENAAFTLLDLRPSTPFYRNDAAAAPTSAPEEATETP
jgi:cell division protein FtsQ